MDMQEKANENINKQPQNSSSVNSTNNQSQKQTLGEYIDFEEIK